MTNEQKSKVSMEEPTTPGIFHIHIDTQSDNKETFEFHSYARDRLKFFNHEFSGHPDGYIHFEPTKHSSFKTKDKSEFDKVWQKLKEKTKDYSKIEGYLEGEYIPTDEKIIFTPMESFFKPPFSIKRRVLSELEDFRQTEFHLSLDWDNSERRVINALLDSGLYGALMKKRDYTSIILTVQGYRKDIRPLLKKTKEYLNEVGGVVRGTIKEEVAICNFKMNYKSKQLPEIADIITYY